MGKDNSKICSEADFKKFKSILNLFTKYIDDDGSFPDEQYCQLGDDIEDFWETMVIIAEKVGVDLNGKFETIIEILEQPEIKHPSTYTAEWAGGVDIFGGDGGLGDAIASEYDKYEEKLKARKETINALNSVGIKLFEYFEEPNKKQGKMVCNWLKAFIQAAYRITIRSFWDSVLHK